MAIVGFAVYASRYPETCTHEHDCKRLSDARRVAARLRREGFDTCIASYNTDGDRSWNEIVESRESDPPQYTDERGWFGGHRRTLYAFVDQRTGKITVRPGDGARGIGPACDARIATRSEASQHWQDPLHSGWRVAD